VSERLADMAEPHATVVASSWPVVRYVLHVVRGRTDVKVWPDDASNGSSEERVLRSLVAGSASWAVTDEQLTMRFPPSALRAWLGTHWNLVMEDAGTQLFRRP